MDRTRLQKQLAFLREIDQVKSVFRQTVLMDASRQENDAEHSWHMAVCAMLFREYLDMESVDLLKTLQMALLHDTIEIYAGDTYAYDLENQRTQEEREREAADKLFSILPDDQSGELRGFWDEFEAWETPEAKYAHLVDAFMPCFHNYCTQGRMWKKHQVTKQMVLKRNEHIRGCSAALWEFMIEMLNDAVEKGYLKEN